MAKYAVIYKIEIHIFYLNDDLVFKEQLIQTSKEVSNIYVYKKQCSWII